MEDISAVEGIVQADIYLYDVAILDGSTIGELVRTSIGKHFNTLRLVRYNIHICHVSNINALFKDYRCPSCDKFIKRAQHLDRHSTTCKERNKMFLQKYPLLR